MLYNLLLLGLLSSSRACSNTAFAQCGGNNFAGNTCCPAGTTCKVQNDWFHQCFPSVPPPSAPAAPQCDLSACDGCSGVQCTACREPLKAACCLRDGGDKDTCCAHGYAQASDVCKASPPPSPPSPPPPTSSPNCALLASRGDTKEINGKWCFQLNENAVEGGCEAYYTQTSKGFRLCTPPSRGSKRCGTTDLFQCQAVPPPPPPPAVPPQCGELAKREDVKLEKNKWCTQLKLEDAGPGGCEAWSTTTRKGSRLCLPPNGDGDRCRVTQLFTCPSSTPMARGVSVELLAADEDEGEASSGMSVLAPGLGAGFLALGAVAFGVRRARRVKKAAAPSADAKATGNEDHAENSLVAVVVGDKRPSPPPPDDAELGRETAVTVRRLSAATAAGARRLSALAAGAPQREALEELSAPIALSQ